jgi:hypothetical protein
MSVCALCGKEIIGTEYKTKSRKRYHNACYIELIDKAEQINTKKTKSIKNGERESLLQYICSIYKIEKIPYAIDKQIENFITQLGYTYSGIQQALYYFYEINGNNPEGQKTIGIVPYCYDETQEFLKKIVEAGEANAGFIKEEKIVHIKIKPKSGGIPCVIDIDDWG